MPKSDAKKKTSKMTARKTKKSSKNQLTDKQVRFCEEYVKDENATQSAIRAGYSEKTARSCGARLLTNVNIQKQIVNIKKDLAKSAKITRDDLLSELKKIGFAEINYTMIQAKDKLKALDTIARMLGLEHPDFSGEIEDLTDTESDIFG